MSNASLDVEDWHQRYVAQDLTRWLLRFYSPAGDNVLWGLFLRKLRHHRHGIDGTAIVGTWILAVACAFIPSTILSFHVWYLFYLVYLPLAAVKTSRLVERSELGMELSLAPGGVSDIRWARLAMLSLVVSIAVMPPVIYCGLKSVGIGYPDVHAPVFEVVFLACAVGAMGLGTAGAMRGRLWVVPLAVAVAMGGYHALFPSVSVEALIFVNRISPPVDWGIVVGTAWIVGVLAAGALVLAAGKPQLPSMGR
jgi:hypothetical protein